MFSFRHADKVLMGDELLIPGCNFLSPTRYTNVSQFQMQDKQFTLAILYKYYLCYHAECKSSV